MTPKIAPKDQKITKRTKKVPKKHQIKYIIVRLHFSPDITIPPIIELTLIVPPQPTEN